ncbi:DUF4362 domain-containing protein [Pseudoneobacillus sp. C159]
MRPVFISVILLLIMAGCQSQSNIKEVVNKHNDIQNIEALNSFVENVKNHKSDKINYVQYGIEGQKGVKTLTFNGKEINVSFRVDGKFIEEFDCKNIRLVTDEKETKYMLSGCKGELGELELVKTNRD